MEKSLKTYYFLLDVVIALIIVNNPLLITICCVCVVLWQLVLTRSSSIIFANYSLVENQRVSSIAAVYSSEYLLFVVGDKVQR